MEKLYLIMDECLRNRYGVRAVITLLETLEISYNEEKQFELKSLACVVKTYLETLEKDISTTISKVDNIIVEEAQKRK